MHRLTQAVQSDSETTGSNKPIIFKESNIQLKHTVQLNIQYKNNHDSYELLIVNQKDTVEEVLLYLISWNKLFLRAIFTEQFQKTSCQFE